MSGCRALTSERGGVLVGRRTSERGNNAADGRFATVPPEKMILCGGKGVNINKLP